MRTSIKFHFNLNVLKKIYNSSFAYITYLQKERYLDHSKNVSDFWQEILSKRRNFPDFNEMVTMRRNSSYPMADGNAATDPWKRSEQEHAKAAYDVVTQTVPKSYFLQFQESSFGAPLAFEFDGKMLSCGGVVNALTSYRIMQWLKKYKKEGVPLRILEIGGGYGQVASHLMQQLPVKSYTFVDLAENLFLCAFYMQANFPNIEASFVTARNTKQSNGFMFLTPDFLDKVKEKYDLVINSYSFQEMNIESVIEYFSFIKRRLNSEGIFYSLNAHGKAGIIKPSDYPLNGFKLEGLSAIRVIPHHYMFATNPYEIVLKNNSNIKKVKKFDSNTVVDSLGFLYQLGITNNLEKISSKFVRNSLSQKELNWLKSIHEWFGITDYTEKLKYITQTKAFAVNVQIQTYLIALLQYAGGDLQKAKTNMESIIHNLHDDYSQLYGYLMLASIYKFSNHKSFSSFYLSKFQKKAPHLQKEALHLIDNYDTLADNIALKIYLARQNSKRFWNSFIR